MPFTFPKQNGHAWVRVKTIENRRQDGQKVAVATFKRRPLNLRQSLSRGLTVCKLSVSGFSFKGTMEGATQCAEQSWFVQWEECYFQLRRIVEELIY